MKLWIDDVRPAPGDMYHEWIWVRTVNMAKEIIEIYGSWVDFDNNIVDCIELIDIDHDAGNYARFGGDYIELLNWLEETGRNYPIHIHSMNPVGVENMRRIIQKNGWREIK